MEKNSIYYYMFKVGRYTPMWNEDKDFVSYKAETKKLVWNVFAEINKKIEVVNLFEYNWVFLKEGLLYAKKHYSDNFIRFAECVREWLQHEYWSRYQYEVYISGHQPDNELKVDVYTQVMLNWDRFIDYIWNNKKLITKKKLNLCA